MTAPGTQCGINSTACGPLRSLAVGCCSPLWSIVVFSTTGYGLETGTAAELRLALTITLTLTDTGFAVMTLLLGYRRRSWFLNHSQYYHLRPRVHPDSLLV